MDVGRRPRATAAPQQLGYLRLRPRPPTTSPGDGDVDADADADAADAQARNHASSSSRDKRRKLEESLALVADPAANHLPAKGAGAGKGKGNAMDALFETGSLVHIDWGQIAYLTVRDQVRASI